MEIDDEISRYNRQRWQALAEVDALWTRPWLDLTPTIARERLDPEGLFHNLDGKRVLCLASGGGQQSAAFALLGAHVTVLDLSPEQLARDRQAASYYDSEAGGAQTGMANAGAVETVQGDMRDLSALPAESFDLVYQPYSLGFVPDVETVFAQVHRVLPAGGMYYLAWGNPFTLGLSPHDWNGDGYVLRQPYVDRAPVETPDADWVYAGGQAALAPALRHSREYRHTLSGVLNALLAQGFALRHLSDSKHLWPDPTAPGGTWDHFVAYAPPFLSLWLERTWE